MYSLKASLKYLSIALTLILLVSFSLIANTSNWTGFYDYDALTITSPIAAVVSLDTWFLSVGEYTASDITMDVVKLPDYTVLVGSHTGDEGITYAKISVVDDDRGRIVMGSSLNRELYIQIGDNRYQVINAGFYDETTGSLFVVGEVARDVNSLKDVFIGRIDPYSGEILWLYTYGWNLTDVGVDITVTPDPYNSVIVLGWTDYFNYPTQDIFILVLDKYTGDINTVKAMHDNENANLLGKSIWSNDNGSFIVIAGDRIEESTTAGFLGALQDSVPLDFYKVEMGEWTTFKDITYNENRHLAFIAGATVYEGDVWGAAVAIEPVIGSIEWSFYVDSSVPGYNSSFFNGVTDDGKELLYAGYLMRPPGRKDMGLFNISYGGEINDEIVVRTYGSAEGLKGYTTWRGADTYLMIGGLDIGIRPGLGPNQALAKITLRHIPADCIWITCGYGVDPVRIERITSEKNTLYSVNQFAVTDTETEIFKRDYSYNYNFQEVDSCFAPRIIRHTTTSTLTSTIISTLTITRTRTLTLTLTLTSTVTHTSLSLKPVTKLVTTTFEKTKTETEYKTTTVTEPAPVGGMLTLGAVSVLAVIGFALALVCYLRRK